MPTGKLTPLQTRALATLAEMEPPWTLTGGAALVGFHTQHRETRDLDLFWQSKDALGQLIDDTVQRLRMQGLDVAVLQRSAAFGRIEVRDTKDSIVIDLVADPVPLAEAPQSKTVEGRTILVDTRHQILVNKLCALLSRSELRDLVDVRAILDAGGDLERALEDCPRQDSGFSPLTFSWAVNSLPIERIARASGWSETQVDELVQFRDELVARVLIESRPP